MHEKRRSFHPIRRRTTIAAAIAAALTGFSFTPTTPAIRPTAPRIEAPIYAQKKRRQSRKMVERQQRRARRRKAGLDRAAAARKARQRGVSHPDPLQVVINQMTNHQRHRWSRHCGQKQALRHDVGLAKTFLVPKVTA